ncbi:MFS transporter [Xenorhabdus sp. Sc-CR9]|uniref:MFS transporter n=1 Tax=Xenorhabdus sp. Sc-CR9 TaxID=2584468 RepID=UPI001F00C8C3|nr:MFS transporter [Xenorhabdus sp. Sc-CR9]
MKLSHGNFSSLHKNVKARVIENFASKFISSMLLPFTAIYLVRYFGSELASLLLVINVIFGLLVNLISGYISDGYGRRRIVLYAEIIRFFAFILMSFFNSPWLIHASGTYFMMLIVSLCWGLSMPVNDAMLIDSSTQEQRKYIYSILYWTGNLSAAFAGAMGGFLFQDYLFEIFMIMSSLSFINLCIIKFFIEESYFPDWQQRTLNEHVIQLIVSYKVALQDRKFVIFLLAGAIILSSELQLTNYIGIHLYQNMPQQDFSFWKVKGAETLGILKSLNTILVVVFILMFKNVAAKLTERKNIQYGALLLVMSYSLMSFTLDIYLLIGFMVIATLGEVFYGPSEQASLAELIPDSKRSIYLACSGLRFNLSLLIVSATVFISTYLQPIYTSLVILGLGFCGILIYRIFYAINETTVEDRL